MQRSPLLSLLVIALAVLARAWVKPVYVGAPDPATADGRFGVDDPFGDDLKGASDALHALLATSVVREGLPATGGWPLLNPSDVEPAEYCWYDHHPPGVSLLTAAAFHAFGTSEAVTRGVALLCSTLTLLVLASLARRAGGGIVAALTVAVVAAPPAGLYWASQLDYPVPTMAACALFLSLACRDGVGTFASFVMGVALTAALCFDFLAVLALAALAIDRLLFGPRGARRLLGWPLLGAAITGIILVWKHFATARYGHGDGLGVLANIDQIWRLDGVPTATYLRTVEGHLRDLVTPLGEAVLAIGLLRALLPGGDAPLRRFVRTTTLLALAAGLLPRVRAWDHPYFQLYWLLPLGGAAALLLTALARPQGGALRVANRLLATAVVGAFLWLGFAGLPRVTPDLARPSSHRLGRELAAKVPFAVPVITIPAATPLNPIQLCWYAGRLVLPAAGDPPDRASLAPALTFYGVGAAEVWWAPDSIWPGRDGVRRLE